VFGVEGAVIAVLDIDADRPGAFDENDAAGLRALVARFAIPRPTPPRALP
jgi:GAF domain-containing protein